MKGLIHFIIYFLFFGLVSAQCDYEEDFSSDAGWTFVGTDINITGGTFNYINNCTDAYQRRIYKPLSNPVKSDDCWNVRFEFFPESVGSLSGKPFTGHLIFSFTESASEPLSDCPDIPCTGNPPGTQDAISISYSAKKPTDGDLHYKLIVRDGLEQYISDLLIYNPLDQLLYVELDKTCDILTLNIFSDPDYSIPLGSGPVTLSIPELEQLKFIQHGNTAKGQIERELNGYIDNVCIDFMTCIDIMEEFTYDGCLGDGFSVTIGNMDFDESNQSGVVLIEGSGGCDTVVAVELNFGLANESFVFYEGCSGDGFSTIINGVEYNESNPIGSELILVANACDSIIIVELDFDNCSLDCPVYIPNIFSPNRDGINDIFKPYYGEECISTNLVIMIYDRWGDLVFKTDYLNEWNGKSSNGNDAIPGVYTYIITLEHSITKKIYAGDVTLVR